MTEKIFLYTDGGARGNPGPAAIGVVISDENSNILKNIGIVIGSTTNNQAEYKALIKGLSEAKDLGAKKIVCYLDSELVVRQLSGAYKVREEGLKDLAMEVLRLQRNFEQVEFKHIPREKNKLADKLVNEALDNAGF